jgi:hypothetical protein
MALAVARRASVESDTLASLTIELREAFKRRATVNGYLAGRTQVEVASNFSMGWAPAEADAPYPGKD